MKTYAYDAENRLISLTEGISTTTYTYNGDGDRVSQTVDGVTTTYVNDTAAPLTMLLAEITGTDTIYYLHGLDLVAQNDGVGSEYFAYDGLGSVRQALDSAEAVLCTQTFDPYGNLYASTGTDSTSFGFTGEQTDSNGLVFLRARYYNPYLNQFIQPDPIVPNPYQPWEWNLFTYSRNNPINFTDPSGKSICYNPLPASCQSALLSLHAKASIIKTAVESGTLEPVEGFAQFADMSKTIFQSSVVKSDI